MKICIDPGHTKNYNAGAVAGYYEGNMTLDLAKRLKTELEKYENVSVVLTRTTDAQNPSLPTRGLKAGKEGCRLFLSLHSDANAKKSIRGVTVVRSLQRPGSQALGAKLTTAIASCMNTSLSPYSGNVNGVWTRAYPGNSRLDYYAVIRNAVTNDVVKEAYLIEHSFHTNPVDCQWLDKAANRQKLAEIEAATIAAHYGLKKKGATSTSATATKLYRVQVGAFSTALYATTFANKLKKLGYATIVVKRGKLYKVQVGAFSKKSNAENLAKELKAKGFSTYIV